MARDVRELHRIGDAAGPPPPPTPSHTSSAAVVQRASPPAPARLGPGQRAPCHECEQDRRSHLLTSSGPRPSRDRKDTCPMLRALRIGRVAAVTVRYLRRIHGMPSGPSVVARIAERRLDASTSVVIQPWSGSANARPVGKNPFTTRRSQLAPPSRVRSTVTCWGLQAGHWPRKIASDAGDGRERAGVRVERATSANAWSDPTSIGARRRAASRRPHRRWCRPRSPAAGRHAALEQHPDRLEVGALDGRGEPLCDVGPLAASSRCSTSPRRRSSRARWNPRRRRAHRPRRRSSLRHAGPRPTSSSRRQRCARAPPGPGPRRPRAGTRRPSPRRRS